MKRNVIAIACAAVVVAAAIVIPLGTGAVPAPAGASPSETAAQASREEAGAQAGNTGSAALDQTAPAATAAADAAASSESYEPGVLLVGLQDNATADDLNALLSNLDYIATTRVADADVTFGYVELKLADGVSVEEAEARIATENPSVVAAAQPNYRYHVLDNAAPTPQASSASQAATASQSSTLLAGIIAQATEIDDPGAENQWALGAVNAYDAWDLAKTEGAVTVAVIDTGLDTTHEDFAGTEIVAPCGVVNGRAVSSTAAVKDGHGHGTHVAGIVAATANNATGVAGVSYNASIMPIRVLDNKGPGTSYDLAVGLNYLVSNATAHNVKVANLSLGGDPDEDDYLMMDAIANAHDKGVLFVYAGGNFDENHSDGVAYTNVPCDSDTDPGAVGVINVNNTLERDSSSNYNMTGQATKDLSAPGTSIYSTVVNSKYGYMTGTSMASPCVAGIAALVFAANPKLTPAQVRNILCNTAADIGETGWDEDTGHGLVDARAAVEAALDSKLTTTSIEGATVTLSSTRCAYTGSAIKPQVVVSIDGATLASGADFTVAYSNNVNVGKATATITGIGAFTGTIRKTFAVVPQSVTPTLTLAATSYVFDGLSKAPAATVRIGTKTLPASSYTLTYASGRANVGKYTVRATLKGNYTGSAATSFTIVPKGTALSKLKAGKKRFTAKWKKQAVQTSGYQVQYSRTKNFTSKCKTLTIAKAKTTSKKIKKLKAKKRYYVRVRTFANVNGVKYYSNWSVKKSVKTKA